MSRLIAQTCLALQWESRRCDEGILSSVRQRAEWSASPSDVLTSRRRRPFGDRLKNPLLLPEDRALSPKDPCDGTGEERQLLLFHYRSNGAFK